MSRHRLSMAEIASAIVKDPLVAARMARAGLRVAPLVEKLRGTPVVSNVVRIVSGEGRGSDDPKINRLAPELTGLLDDPRVKLVREGREV